jgi:hypothetical protein
MHKIAGINYVSDKDRRKSIFSESAKRPINSGIDSFPVTYFYGRLKPGKLFHIFHTN